MLFGLFSKKNTHKEQKDETPSQDSTNDKSINGEVNFLDLEDMMMQIFVRHE